MKNCTDGTCHNADLIEALTADRDAAMAEVERCRGYTVRVAKLEEEVEKLRATLTDINAMLGYADIPSGTHQFIIDLLFDIGTATNRALEVKP